MTGFNFREYAKKIAGLGREISPEALGGARALVQPNLAIAPFADVAIARDESYGPHARHRLDAFTPVKAAGQRPVLVYIHGGGFIMGDKYTPGTPFFDNVGVWAVRNGMAAVNMTYRLAPESMWPSGVEDLRLAMNYIQVNASRFGFDAGKVFLAGHSAGASHAASYLTHDHLYAPAQHGVAGLILLSGMYDFTAYEPSEKETSYLGKDISRYGEYSSMKGLVETSTPLLVAMAEHDPAMFMRQSVTLIRQRLERHGTLPQTVYMTGQNHVSGILCLGLEGDVLGPQILQFVERNGS